MLKLLIDKVFHHWQGRFKNGLNFGLGGGGINRYDNGAIVVTFMGPNVVSAGTGHWPWMVFEVAWANGPRPSWHVAILGFTVGKVVVNDYDQETGKIAGPDKSKHYYFFKGINHCHQSFEDITG